ncbi:MAG: hypothetical protein JNK30_21050 [Phenylobacterium sp.]|uniref:hypothetical protein n=1 Tax=Phenylobacterium sp. TaxID=1871053 RepID=UPI001A63BBFE|nr:hypothetical protein [Phenylobacterium sp.]MBL8773888.1 hypothetical protein [Phenylobacterium sp.]
MTATAPIGEEAKAKAAGKHIPEPPKVEPATETLAEPAEAAAPAPVDPAPVLSEEVVETVEVDDRVQITDEVGPRGRVIAATRGGRDGPTTTREEVLPPHATDAEAAKAKERLRAAVLR